MPQGNYFEHQYIHDQRLKYVRRTIKNIVRKKEKKLLISMFSFSRDVLIPLNSCKIEDSYSILFSRKKEKVKSIQRGNSKSAPFPHILGCNDPVEKTIENIVGKRENDE